MKNHIGARRFFKVGVVMSDSANTAQKENHIVMTSIMLSLLAAGVILSVLIGDWGACPIPET